MSLFKYVAVLPSVTGIPRDNTQNTFYIDQTVVPSTVASAINSFFQTRPTGALQSINTYMSQCISGAANAFQIKQYNVLSSVTGAVGPPINIFDFTWTTSTAGTPLPLEVAVVLSLHADLTGIPEHSGTTRPRARRRGRLYIGPLNTSAIDVYTTSPKVPRVAAQFMSDLQVATKALSTALGAGMWSVASRVEHDAAAIVGGFIDDRPDVQRRRRPDPLSRNTFTIP